jgi:hypothetical protein
LRTDISERSVKPHARQGAHQFAAREAVRVRFALAALQQRLADTLACIVRIHKERPDLRGIDCGIQFQRVALGMGIAAKQRAAATPATAADQPAFSFNDEIRAVINQLRVDAECAAQCAFNLLRSVISRAQSARGAGDESLELSSMRVRGLTELVLHCLRA